MTLVEVERIKDRWIVRWHFDESPVESHEVVRNFDLHELMNTRNQLQAIIDEMILRRLPNDIALW
jgi:hypothetical protein